MSSRALFVVGIVIATGGAIVAASLVSGTTRRSVTPKDTSQNNGNQNEATPATAPVKPPAFIPDSQAQQYFGTQPTQQTQGAQTSGDERDFLKDVCKSLE